jgi:hypothetical protein
VISGKVENVNLHAIDYHVGLIGSPVLPPAAVLRSCGCSGRYLWLVRRFVAQT